MPTCLGKATTARKTAQAGESTALRLQTTTQAKGQEDVCKPTKYFQIPAMRRGSKICKVLAVYALIYHDLDLNYKRMKCRKQSQSARLHPLSQPLDANSKRRMSCQASGKEGTGHG